MSADKRLAKALGAARDALQHLALANLCSLDCTHIDRLLSKVVDLPTEGSQRNIRRNLLTIRQWMIEDGSSVVLLEVLGQLYWRLGELNSKQFKEFRTTLEKQESYKSLIQDQSAILLVVQRVRHIQKAKVGACEKFLCELPDIIDAKGWWQAGQF